MTSMTSLQIIIPYYKEFDYFHESLTSVINQDYKNFSIMVIDDGTKDNRVVQLINSLQDNRITLIQNENNLGLSRNFEFARTQASADFLVFLGQDDILQPDYISTVLPWISSSDSIAIAQPNVRIIDAFGKERVGLSDYVKKLLHKTAWFFGQTSFLNGQKGSIISGRRAAGLLLLGDFLYFPTIMWRASAMKSFDVSRGITLDYRMLIDVLDDKNDLLLIDANCANYRRHDRSASMIPSNLINRIKEERETHRFFSNHFFVRKSMILRFINFMRITHRFHVLQIIFSTAVRRDWANMTRALKCL